MTNYNDPNTHYSQQTVQVPVERIVQHDVNPVVAQAVEPSHWSKWWWLPLLLLGLLGSVLWHGCHTVNSAPARTETVHVTLTETQTAAPVETVHEGVTETETAQAGPVTQTQAQAIALAAVPGSELVSSDSGTENGVATWEFVVREANGAQHEVYVAQNTGAVVKVEAIN